MAGFTTPSITGRDKMHLSKRKSRFSILVVEDEKFLRDIFREALVARGYKVKTAQNGMAALKKMQAEPFDMLLTDMNMPGMNGLELLEKIYDKRISITPIIMSSMLSDEIKSHAFQKGALASLDKPFSFSYLFSIIENRRSESTVTLSRHADAVGI
jgi:CheY-like chemotaxis protein